jgi:creatinine amidohydrolase
MAKRLRDMSWTEFDEFRKNCDLVILPSGAIEEYGPHMPMGSDIIAAEAIAHLVADATGALVGPSLEVGDSRVLSAFPGTMCVSEANFKGYMSDICESLRRWGFKRFLFITGHAGNLGMIAGICKGYKVTHPELKMAQIDWWRFASQNTGDALVYKDYMAHGHAAECGTSVMLHLHPELVNMEAAASHKLESENLFPDVVQYFSIKDKTSSGVIGDPTIATAEKGEKVVKACLDRILAFIESEF